MFLVESVTMFFMMIVLLQGVCCDDNLHCCPHGYVCAEEPGTCRIPGAAQTVSTFLNRLTSLKAIPHT